MNNTIAAWSGSSEIYQLVRALRVLNVEREKLDDEAEEIKRRLRNLVPFGESIQVDGRRFSVQANRRFNVELAVEKFIPEATRPAFQVVAYDAARVRKFLSPAQVDACLVVVGENKIIAG